MAKGQHYSSYQKGVIKRFYDNKGTISRQKLGELITELYLETSAKKLDRLWKQVETGLVNSGTNKTRVEKIMADRDLEALAKLVSDIF